MAATTTTRAQSQYVGDTTSDLFIRDVSKWPKLIKRNDFPLTASIKDGPPMKNPKLKMEWGISYFDPIVDTLSSGINNSTTTVTPTNIGYYMVGHIFMIDAEEFLVTAVGASDLTVTTRGAVGGTSAASHATSAGIRIIGIAVKENADDSLGPITQGEVDYNYFQIFTELLQFSQRAKDTATWETDGDRLQMEVKKKLSSTMPQHVENTLLWGARALGSTTAPSLMGGVFQTSYSTSTTDMNGAILTEYDFLEAVQKGYNQVGSSMVGKRVMTHPFYKRVFANWNNNIRMVGGDTKKISNVFDTFETDFGTFEWMSNHHMVAINNSALPDGRMLIYDPDDFTLRPYSSSTKWGVYAVAESGWYSRRAIRGDYSLEAINPEKRVTITEMSTTALDYPNFTS